MSARRMLHVLPILGLSITGCAFRTATPAVPAQIAGDSRPPAHLEVSSVDVVTTGPVTTPKAYDIPSLTRKILAYAARRSRTGDGPATVSVEVTLGKYGSWLPDLEHDGIVLMPLLPVFLAGVVFEHQALRVDLVVTREGQRFLGHGKAEKAGSLYAPALKRALAVALDRALADASGHRVD
jgi:hypothetical protein